MIFDLLHELAPPHLAAPWDNTGLLVEGTRPIRTLGLCIDLTEPVLDELLAAEVDLIISYHPPIFKGLTSLTTATPLGRTLLRVLRAGLHIYSPHTALDAASEGMGDWLASCLSPVEVAPIEPAPTNPAVGMGRRGTLPDATSVATLLPRLKAALGLDHVRVAGDLTAPRHTFAVCPGAGGSLFEALAVDLYLTGEMRHHDVLAKVGAGSAVILTDHTNTERGFLPVLAGRLRTHGFPVHVATTDRDPLTVV